jgi:amino acid transporter
MLRGIKESITLNNIFTIGILIFYMYCNVLSVVIFEPKFATPFFKGGLKGVMKGAAVCFFGYTSFE